MQNKSRAFTLIELLVVVLIIGILAAVAVPQYQKAVWKSRNVQLKVLVNAMIKAQNAYYLANGEYAKSLGDLGIDLPNWTSSKEANTYFATTNEEDSARSNGQILIGISQGFNNYAVWQDGPYQYGGFRGLTKISCIERKSKDLTAGSFCEKLEGGVESNTESETWRSYTLP